MCSLLVRPQQCPGSVCIHSSYFSRIHSHCFPGRNARFSLPYDTSLYLLLIFFFVVLFSTYRSLARPYASTLFKLPVRGRSYACRGSHVTCPRRCHSAPLGTKRCLALLNSEAFAFDGFASAGLISIGTIEVVSCRMLDTSRMPLCALTWSRYFTPLTIDGDAG